MASPQVHRSPTWPSRSIVTSMTIPGETLMAPVKAPDRTTAPASRPRPAAAMRRTHHATASAGWPRTAAPAAVEIQLAVGLEDDPDEVQRQAVRRHGRTYHEPPRGGLVGDDIRQREAVVAVARVEDFDGRGDPLRGAQDIRARDVRSREASAQAEGDLRLDPGLAERRDDQVLAIGQRHAIGQPRPDRFVDVHLGLLGLAGQPELGADESAPRPLGGARSARPGSGSRRRRPGPRARR